MSRFEVLRNVDETGRQLEVDNDKYKLDTPRIKVGSVKLKTRDYDKLALKIAKLGKACLDIITSHRVFKEKYRIVLSSENDDDDVWNLYLHVDPVAWFDALIWIKHKTREEAVQKAREFVDKMREKYQYSLPPLSDYEPVPSKLYCTHHGECNTCE